jgi:hypothetical protein
MGGHWQPGRNWGEPLPPTPNIYRPPPCHLNSRPASRMTGRLDSEECHVSSDGGRADLYLPCRGLLLAVHPLHQRRICVRLCPYGLAVAERQHVDFSGRFAANSAFAEHDDHVAVRLGVVVRDRQGRDHRGRGLGLLNKQVSGLNVRLARARATGVSGISVGPPPRAHILPTVAGGLSRGKNMNSIIRFLAALKAPILVLSLTQRGDHRRPILGTPTRRRLASPYCRGDA